MGRDGRMRGIRGGLEQRRAVRACVRACERVGELRPGEEVRNEASHLNEPLVGPRTLIQPRGPWLNLNSSALHRSALVCSALLCSALLWSALLRLLWSAAAHHPSPIPPLTCPTHLHPPAAMGQPASYLRKNIGKEHDWSVRDGRDVGGERTENLELALSGWMETGIGDSGMGKAWFHLGISVFVVTPVGPCFCTVRTSRLPLPLPGKCARCQ
ncbi:hypothetical protein BKA61DRAFT_237166 [Leptodontidium sp. MPI-SDFR-AT-0119]|nr:hypothetical protein BKA61DRAFT_237166 [Leptodontidium sp. MPI-SDFR-AT-0119]